MIESFFVSEKRRFHVLGADAPPRARETAFTALPPGGYLALALRLDGPSRWERARALLALRPRVRALERTIARLGAVPAGAFGVYPELAAPTVVYELRSSAAQYADRRILVRPGAGWARALERALGAVAGCNPSVAAVLVAGRKP